MAMVGCAARGVLAAGLLLAAAPLAADDDFLHSALLAGSVASDVARWQQAYALLRDEIVTDELLSLPPDERLAAIEAALHRQILNGKYEAAASDLRLALSRGDFNCLSAAALLFDLCRAAGIELEIWWRPGHVWLQTAEGETIEPAARQPAESPSLTHRVGGTPSLARRVGVGRRLTTEELLGKFYYNRGVQLLAQGQYAEGLAHMRTALALDPLDGDARENLLAGINNWAAQHLRARRYRDASRLIQQGLALEPNYGPLVANRRLLAARAE